jgi:hypothetical protein
MPNPPYSGSVIIIKETQDGLILDAFHWAEIPEDMSVPPAGPLTAAKMAGGALRGTDVTTKRLMRSVPTRADAITKLTQFLAANYPDTPAT